MSDMMKMFVEQELQNQIKENYPHMQYPPGLYAKVVSVRQNGELYEARSICSIMTTGSLMECGNWMGAICLMQR